MKILLMTLAFTVSQFAFADSGTLSLAARLNGLSLVCSSANKEVGRVSSKNGQIQISDGLCFGGSEVNVEETASFVIITCGDDGRQTTTLNLDQKLTKNSELIDGTTYANISAGYPYADGSVQYLTCTAK